MIRFLESAGDFSLRQESRMVVGPTHIRDKSAPATPSQWVRRTGHEGDNSLIYLLPNVRMSGAASSPPSSLSLPL